MTASALLLSRLAAVIGGALVVGCSGSAASSPPPSGDYGPTAGCNTAVVCVPGEVCSYVTGPATMTAGLSITPTQSCLCEAAGTFDCTGDVAPPAMPLYCYDSADSTCLAATDSAQIQTNLAAKGGPPGCGPIVISSGPVTEETTGGTECCYQVTPQDLCGGRPLEIGGAPRRAGVARRADWT